jgi:DNA-binding CsgD family transcriptional regulator
VEAAHAAACELVEVADAMGAPMLRAAADHVAGAVALARGDAGGALAPLRAAVAGWRGLGAPYEAARAQVLIALACRELGDRDGAELELHGARAVLERLGARSELERLTAQRPGSAGAATSGLSLRELEVLRLVAVGRSNRAIAAELVLSEHTVARHVQNIFAKLDVTSRTAAAAFAFEHGLM